MGFADIISGTVDTLSTIGANEMNSNIKNIIQELIDTTAETSNKFIDDTKEVWADDYAQDFSEAFNKSMNQCFKEVELNGQTYAKAIKNAASSYSSVGKKNQDDGVKSSLDNIRMAKLTKTLPVKFEEKTKNGDEFGFRDEGSVSKVNANLTALETQLEGKAKKAADTILSLSAFNEEVQEAFSESAEELVKIYERKIKEIKASAADNISKTQQRYAQATLSAKKSAKIGTGH